MAAAFPSSPAGYRHRLSALLAGFAAVDAASDRDVAGLELDSRRVGPGDLFLACAGTRAHGLQFVGEAVRAGAAAVVYEPAAGAAVPLPATVPLIAVPDLGRRAGELAARFYGDPSAALTVVGITGTNGKTSCSHYLAQALTDPGGTGAACGLIGTLGCGTYGDLRPLAHTTPDALTLQRELFELRARGVRHVMMEVSSHALDQGRVAGMRFAGAVFTNLTHDHLDYHGDLLHYGQSKARLFAVPGLRYAAINCEDAFGRTLLAGLPPAVTGVAYGLSDTARAAGARFVRGRILHAAASGLELEIASSWGDGRLRSALLGRFNASNLLATLAVLLMMDLPLPEALERLAATRPVAGRMERFGGEGGRPLAVVDYAHTPDALRQVLETLRPYCRGRLICVFGCGGDRDRSKRPVMGAVAERHADRVIVTDDNPRREEPGAIIAAILAGMQRPDAALVVPEREEAIRQALAGAGAGDVVLIAGKGHEDYQLIGDQRLPFSDREQVRRLLGEHS